MSILKLLQPNGWKLGVFFVTGLITSLIPSGMKGTTKITWDEFHGIPYTFIKLTGCYGPCYPDKIGVRYTIQSFELHTFLFDAAIWYVFACILIYGLSILIQNKKTKAIVIGKS